MVCDKLSDDFQVMLNLRNVIESFDEFGETNKGQGCLTDGHCCELSHF